MPATMMMVALALAAALLQAPLVQRSVDRGDQSNVEDLREVAVRSQAEWVAVWRQHAPDRPRPEIDFGREMVVGVFLGSRTTAGFAVEIVEVIDAGDSLVARYRVTTPGRDTVAAQVLAFPYHLIAVPARPGPVRFERVG